MIVLDGSVIGLLLEAALVVCDENVSLVTLYCSASGATGMVYYLQTLYANVHAEITNGENHAIQYKLFKPGGLRISSIDRHTRCNLNSVTTCPHSQKDSLEGRAGRHRTCERHISKTFTKGPVNWVHQSNTQREGHQRSSPSCN